MTPTNNAAILKANGLSGLDKGDLAVYSPIDGALLGKLTQEKKSAVSAAIKKSQKAFDEWKAVPAGARKLEAFV